MAEDFRGGMLRRGSWAVAIVMALWQACALAADPPSQFRDCADCPEMVRVPAGTFTMGTALPEGRDASTRAESQASTVRIAKTFALGRVEVTRKQYLKFLADSTYDGAGPCVSWDDTLGRFNSARERGPENPGRPKPVRDDHPVACVSWLDAKAYVAWLAHKTGKPYRLPSESEWEYAARAGSTTLYPWGDDPADGCDSANVYDLSAAAVFTFGWKAVRCTDGFADVAPVGQLRANAFGLVDMIGNVAEWVEDCYTDSYVGRPADGLAWVWSGGCGQHVVRGGSWVSPAETARSAYRDEQDTNFRADFIGFRVALDLDTRAEGH
jgi:formylglycine-generating enzyme required for sulfatase activity